MQRIENRSLTLKLNKHFVVADVALVGKSICDIVAGTVLALDINYKLDSDGNPTDELDYFTPVDWNTWIDLPIRKWDMSIHSKNLNIRVPTVVVTKNYSKVRYKDFKGKPNKQGVYLRDNGIDGFTGLEIELSESTLEHVLPLSRGGLDEYSNVILTTKAINNKKGNKTVEEAGLKLHINPYHPRPIPMSSTITRVRNSDWNLFICHKK